MPKNGGRRARMSAQDKAELLAFRQREAEAAAMATAAAESKDLVRSDWICRHCSYPNFGRNSCCRRCTQPRSQTSRHVPGAYNGRAVVPPSFRVTRHQAQGQLQLPTARHGPFHGAGMQRGRPNVAGGANTAAESQRRMGAIATVEADRPNQTALRQPGRCYADALRSPPREVEQAQNRERNRAQKSPTADEEETRPGTESGNTAEAAGGPTHFDVGAEDSDVEEHAADAASAGPVPVTAKMLLARIRNLETKKERREKKMLRQQKAVDEQNEFIEEQHRKLNTLVFELADTREDIAAYNLQIEEASRQHTELISARVAAHGYEAEDDEGEGEDHRVSAIVHQVMASMRVNGRLRTNALQKLLSSLMQEVDAFQAAETPRGEGRFDVGTKRGRSPSRSPAPRTPQAAVVASAGAATVQPVTSQNDGTNLRSPQREPTAQMRQEAQAALRSDNMWQDEAVKASVNEAIAGALVAVSAGTGPELPCPRRQIAQQVAPSPLAICDRPASEPRGRWKAAAGHSPARSRDRKDLYKELNDRVEKQKHAASRGRPM